MGLPYLLLVCLWPQGGSPAAENSCSIGTSFTSTKSPNMIHALELPACSDLDLLHTHTHTFRYTPLGRANSCPSPLERPVPAASAVCRCVRHWDPSLIIHKCKVWTQYSPKSVLPAIVMSQQQQETYIFRINHSINNMKSYIQEPKIYTCTPAAQLTF